MRNAFADEVTRMAAQDPRVVLLSGDIGNRLFDKLRAQSPDRFINAGIAEANMMGMAAGLALSGLRPVVYTITPFTTTRCFEQIRVDVAYHQAPVIIVGTGSGLSYASLGPTHHSLEDMAILRTLPGLNVTAPCDSSELRSVLRAALASEKPTYIRIGKKGEAQIHGSDPDVEFGKFLSIKHGTDVTFICAGTLMSEALRAADALERQGLSVEVLSAHTVKPLDADWLANQGQHRRLIVSIEEHGLTGGLGGAIAEWCVNECHSLPLLMIGTPDRFMSEIGSQAWARKMLQISAHFIEQRVLERLGKPT